MFTMVLRALPDNSMRYLWVLLFLIAAVLWSIQIGRPVDLPNWHEFDYSSIARNFLREGNNILYPRIDWRGDGPGFTEMEFPIIPWVIGQLYRIFGTHEIIGRILSYIFSLLALFVFSRIALKVLPEAAAMIAALFFVVSHIVTLVATAILPEALMLLFYLLAVYFFLDWYDRQGWRSYALAIVCFASAMLVKSPAAHLAIFFFIWAVYKDGLRAFRRPSLYLFATLSFSPVILWYAHAASLWHQFHKSMGVSNEDHWFGLDLLRRPKVILNFLCIDGLLVCGGGGAIVALVALAKDRMSSAVNRLAICWSVAVGVYLIVIMRTASGYWASYYHVVAVPPIALLFAAGISNLRKERVLTLPRILTWSLLAAGILVVAFVRFERLESARLPGVIQDLLNAHSSLPVLLVLAVLATGATLLCLGPNRSTVPSGQAAFMISDQTAPMVILGCFCYFFLSGQMLLGAWKAFATRTAEFNAAKCLKDKIAHDSLIVASGGICSDGEGHRAANDAPDMFYWLDRKGFSTCQGHESVTELQEFSSRGARYFVADKVSLKAQPGFETELRNSFPLLEDCDAVMLVSLQPR